jgi:hypothetical protein
MDYLGHKVIWHNGEVQGIYSSMAFMPDDGFGLFTSLTGSVSQQTPLLLLRYFITNLLLGLEQWVHPAWCDNPKESKPNIVHKAERSEPEVRMATRSRLRKGQTMSTNPQTVSAAKATSLQHSVHSTQKQLGPSSQISAPSPVFVGVYSNAVYDLFKIVSVSQSDQAIYPHVSAAPITLQANWSTIFSMGLSASAAGTENAFDAHLTTPYSWYLGAPLILDGVRFDVDVLSGKVRGLWWAIDPDVPPYFTPVQKL